MKQLYFIVFTLLLMNCGGPQPSHPSNNNAGLPLSESEITLLDSLEIDKDILKTVRNYTDSAISPMNSIDDYYEEGSPSADYKPHGFTFQSQEKDTRRTVYTLYEDLREKGYFIYTSETNFGYSPDQVTVLRGKDQFDILRAEGTNGINHDVYPEDVIKKLTAWHKQFPFEIVGADNDWIEARFITRFRGMEKLAREVYDFCPDVVDQGTETVENLAMEMKQTNTLYLWWD